MRIYADTNSKDNDAYWRLSYNGRPLDEVASAVGLIDGMAVVIYYEDESEEFEWDATLHLRPTGKPPAPQWVASVNEASFRRLR